MGTRILQFLFPQAIRKSHCEEEGTPARGDDYFLCDLEVVLSFDLETIEDPDSLNRISFTKTIQRRGRLDGCCFYFNTIFDEEISFSTSPLAEKTVWGSRLLACEAKEYEEGDAIGFELTINDPSDHSTWQWRCEGK